MKRLQNACSCLEKLVEIKLYKLKTKFNLQVLTITTKLYSFLLVNAADNKQRDKNMSCIKVTIDP